MPEPKRVILSIDAASVADFRAQLDAAVALAQRVAGVPVLPPAGSASEAALVKVLADLIEARCMVQSADEQAKAA